MRRIKQLGNRVLSLFLALSLSAGLLPAAVAAEDGTPEVQELPGVGLTLDDGVETEGLTFSAFAANGVDAQTNLAASQYDVAEHGVYSVTVYRAGDLDVETALRVSALDISAVYGEDYRIVENGYGVYEIGADTTITSFLTPEAQQRAAAETARYQEEQLAALEAERETREKDDPGAPGGADRDDAGVKGSPLAAMKEAQTGQPARTPAGQLISDFSDDLISYMGGAPTDYFDPSAMLELSFAPGETTKKILFEILDDETSEGTEAFSLVLDGLNDSSFVVTPFMTTVLIRDDEPVEHSAVTFAQAEYTADGTEVKVVAVRSGAEYSFATVGIRSLQDGTARRGLNYADVDTVLQFLPNQTAAELSIPVRPDAALARDFSLELYDPMGCVLGDRTNCHVTIPVKAAGDAGAARLMGAPATENTGYSAGSTVTLGDTTYTLKAGDKDGVFKLMKGSHYAGDFYMPSLFQYWEGGDDEPNSNADWSYHAGAVRGQPGPVGHLLWYSHWTWQTGWCCAAYSISQPERYQQVYTDMKTDSGLNSVSMGFAASLMNSQVSAYDRSGSDYLGSSQRERKIYGPYNLIGTKNEGGKEYLQYKAGYVGGDYLSLRFEAERTGFSAGRPEVWFWGVACLFTQFNVKLEQPEPMKFRTVNNDGTVTTTERAPAKVAASGWNQNDPLYLGEKVVTYSEPADSDVICGTLVGYNVFGEKKDNSKTEAVFVAKDKDTESFVLDYDLQHKLYDKGATYVSTGKHYAMPVTVQPVYQYKDVSVEAVPHTNAQGQVIGAFTNNLTGTYHVGDQLPMDAAAAEGFGGWSYETYRADGYKNPGDRTPVEFAGPNAFAEKRVLTLVNRQYKLAPVFSDRGNYIAVWLDDRATQNFSFDPSDVLTEAEVRATGKAGALERFQAGWSILRTEAADQMTPTAGKAYTVSLVPNDSAFVSGGGNVTRPVFTSDWENVEVQGYCFDLIADADPTRNLIRVSSETVPAGTFWTLSLEGKAQYSSVSLRDGAEDLKNVPAIGVMVTAGGNWIAGSPAKTKLMRVNATTGQDGTFSLDGVTARVGDTISVLMQHSGVWQVRYVTIGTLGSTKERSVSVPSYNSATESVDIRQETRSCRLVNLGSMKRQGVHTKEVDNLTGAFNLPIRTPYTPYIRNFTFTYANNPAGSTLGNRVEIVDGDRIIFRFEVEDNGQNVESVKLRFYDDQGNVKHEGTARPEGANSRYYRAEISSDSLMPGWALYLQIASAEKEQITSPTGERIQADKFFPTINSGLAFFVPDREGLKYNIGIDLTKGMNLPPYIGDIPALGSYASNAESGKLVFETVYDNPSDPKSGRWSWIVGGSVEFDKKTMKDLSEKFDAVKRKGGSQKAKPAIADYDEAGLQMKAEARAAKEEQLKAQFPNDQQKVADKLNEWDNNPKNADNVFQEEAYKNGVLSVAKDKSTLTIALFLRFEYYYNKTTNSWDWTGWQLIVHAAGATGKTFPTYLGPVPVYMYVGGSLFFTMEMAYTFSKAEELVAKTYMQRSGNIAPVFSNASPWITLGGSLEFWFGVGFNKLVSVRGIVALDAAFKFNLNTNWSPNYGYNLGVKGGIGLDLALVKFNWKVDVARLKDGAFYKVKPTYSQVSDDGTPVSNTVTGETAAAARLMGMSDAPQFTLEALDMGSETYSAFGGARLMSIPKPYAEKNLVEGTLEYVHPTVVQLDDTHYMLFYLRNDANTEGGRTESNASSINYTLGTYNAENEDITWGESVPLEQDGKFDTAPAVLKHSNGNIYVAWSNAENSAGTEAADVKQALSRMDIHMTSLTEQGGSYQPSGKIWQVTDDAGDTRTAFMNTSAILTEEENGRIAVTYLKTDVDQLNLEAFASSGENPYSTWARKIYDPNSGEAVLQATATGGTAEEYLIPVENDRYTPEYSTAVYKWNGRVYRLSAYVLDSMEGSAEESMELWVKADNLTDQRFYAPLLVDRGSESLMGAKLTNVNRTLEPDERDGTTGSDGKIDDLFLTWITDGTVLHTLSAYNVFRWLAQEDGAYWDMRSQYGGGGTKSLELIQSLDEDAIAREGWPAAALAASNQGGASGETDGYPVLRALTNETIASELGIERDFGETLVSTSLDENNGDIEKEQTVRNGLSLDQYQVVSGKDGNAYLFWIWPTGLSDYDTDDVGSEIWGSSYTEVLSVEAFEGMEDEDEYLVETWSRPVQISDCSSLSDENMKDGRMIDELYTLVGTKSGAIMLANTYDVSFNEDGSLKYGAHNLTQILCESTGSLEVSEPELIGVRNSYEPDGNGGQVLVKEYAEDESILYPVPGEHYALTLELKNAGLLSTRSYTLEMHEIVDGVQTNTYELTLYYKNTEDPPLLTAGDTRTVHPIVEDSPYGDYVVPEYNSSLELRFTIQEHGPAGEPYENPGECVWSASRKSAFDFHSLPDSSDYLAPSLMTMEELSEFTYSYGSTREEIDAAVQELGNTGSAELVDGRVLSLLDLAENDLEAWRKQLEERTPADKLPYVAFLPVRNIGSRDAGELSAKVVYETYTEEADDPQITTVGTGSLSALKTGEGAYIVVPVALSPEQFSSSGLVELLAQVSCQGKRVDDDALLLEYHTPDNVSVNLSVPDAGSKLTKNKDGSLVLNLRAGETAALKSEAWPYGSVFMDYYAYAANGYGEPGFAVDLDGMITAVSNGKGFVYAVDAESGCIGIIEVNVTGGAEPDPDPDSPMTYDDGKSSTGGASVVQILNVNARSDSASVPLKVQMDGNNVTIQEISAGDLSKLTAEEPGDRKKEIVFDLSGLNLSVESLTIPAPIFREVEKAVAGNETGGFVVVRTPEWTLTLDRPALESIAMQGGDIRLGVVKQSVDSLSAEQKNALGEKKAAAAYDVTLSAGGMDITALDGGRIHVSIPFTPENGRRGNDYRVYYLPESGAPEIVAASWLGGSQRFWSGHCSDYVLVYEPAVNSFRDVGDGLYYTGPVLWAVSGGITDGTGTDTFSPGEITTRAQMVTFLWRATGSPKPKAGKNPFNDVPEDAWYRDAVLWAVQAGVTDGVSADEFAPNQAVDRAQCVTFLWRDARNNTPAAGARRFTDVPENTWYSDAVAWAAGKQITLGTGDTEFSPANSCKRSEIVTFLYRYFHTEA